MRFFDWFGFMILVLLVMGFLAVSGCVTQPVPKEFHPVTPAIQEYEPKGFPEPMKSQFLMTCQQAEPASFCLCVEYYTTQVFNFRALNDDEKKEAFEATLQLCKPYSQPTT